MIEVQGDHRRGINPHREQRRPAEELRDREALHDLGHAGEIADDIGEHVAGAAGARERDPGGVGDTVRNEQAA